MQLLKSKELVEAIKAKQAAAVEAMQQTAHTKPKLAIIVTVENPVIDIYMRMKQKYGTNLGIDVDIHRVAQAQAIDTIGQLNQDPAVNGIIVQLPLEDPSETEAIVNQVAPQKDVDALGNNAAFIPATPMAILWLLAGHQIDLYPKKVVLVGYGPLVGKPLQRLLAAEKIDVTIATRSLTPDIAAVTRQADVIITATGSPGALRTDMIKSGAVVIDAGTASEGGKTVGDLASNVYERDDLTITPTKGGVGPLTVCALFENVLRAAGANLGEGSLPLYYRTPS